jgi:hypothetical protein
MMKLREPVGPKQGATALDGAAKRKHRRRRRQVRRAAA